jgi:hypothetical protein
MDLRNLGILVRTRFSFITKQEDAQRDHVYLAKFSCDQHHAHDAAARSRPSIVHEHQREHGRKPELTKYLTLLERQQRSHLGSKSG